LTHLRQKISLRLVFSISFTLKLQNFQLYSLSTLICSLLMQLHILLQLLCNTSGFGSTLGYRLIFFAKPLNRAPELDKKCTMTIVFSLCIRAKLKILFSCSVGSS
jgi:hypothetical protein